MFNLVQVVNPVQLAAILAVGTRCTGFAGRTEFYTKSAPNRFKR
jgi:hypothetical protein